MIDYTALYQQLWQQVKDHEDQLVTDSDTFLIDFIKQLKASGYELDNDSLSVLNSYFAGIKTTLESGIASAAGIGMGGVAVAQSMQSLLVLAAMEKAFKQRWPDGLTLSERLWNLEQNLRLGVENVLKAGIKQSKASNTLIYSMQREIEKANAGEKFKIISKYQQDDWAGDLYSTAKQVIHDPKSRAAWEKSIIKVQAHIEKLKYTGTRSAAEQVFKQIKEAVATGNTKLLDDALKWWVYDKQLYQLKRIVRTEMANSAHQAVIDTTIDDVTVIGYQWRLSSSHPAGSSCVCSMYANIDMDMGKGVWTKDKVPLIKPHPHCMCLIVPRVTKIKQAGKFSLTEIESLTKSEK